jgi:hypothetical protein
MDKQRMGVMRALGLTPGQLGMAIGCYSAWFELTKGAESPTSGYVALGGAAFVLAIGAGVAPLVLRHQLVRAAVVMVMLETLGYFFALACWVLAGGILLLASRSDASSAQ